MAVIQRCVDTAFFGQVCDACDGGSIYKIIAEVIKILTLIIGPLAIIGIIIAGIMYMTASGDSSRQTKAKRRIVDIVIGLGCYAVMFAFANFLIPGGVIKSTLDSTTSSCPVERRPQQQQQDEDEEDEEDQEDEEEDEDQEEEQDGYPMARTEGEPIPGYIKCPRNADYTYTANPAGKSGTLDKWLQSVAGSCPFTEVKYSKTAADTACAPGGNMHDNGKWCIVNTKIDPFEYQSYLLNNHIKQDGRTCLADKQECSSAQNLSDWGACYYFSVTFASNMNNGEVVSNDAYAAQLGVAFHHAYWGRTQYGTRETTWNKRQLSVYDDGLAEVQLNPNVSAPLPRGYSASGMGEILSKLRSGQAVAIGVHSTRVDSNPNKNCGHYMVAIGYAKSCANGASCSANNLVVMNTDGKISTLGSSNYRLGYRRACTGP